MTQDKTKVRQPTLDEELVPLAVAARAAYFEVTAHTRDKGTEEELAEVSHLVALALSTVAPIHMTIGDAGRTILLQSREVNDLMFLPLRERRQRPSFDGLSIRRSDLRAAIMALKDARNAFGRFKADG
jgi:hypothetical protein